MTSRSSRRAGRSRGSGSHGCGRPRTSTGRVRSVRPPRAARRSRADALGRGPARHGRPPALSLCPSGSAECTGRGCPRRATVASASRQRDVDALAEQQLALQPEVLLARSEPPAAVSAVPTERPVRRRRSGGTGRRSRSGSGRRPRRPPGRRRAGRWPGRSGRSSPRGPTALRRTARRTAWSHAGRSDEVDRQVERASAIGEEVLELADGLVEDRMRVADTSDRNRRSSRSTNGS